MGLARKMKREQSKLQYKRFQKAWNDEKMFQKYLVDTQNAKIIEKDGTKVLAAENSDEHTPILGRKPTFSMWAKTITNQQSAASAASQNSTKMDVEDLSWDEGG